MLKAMYIPTEASVIQGDTIQTSGLGGIYPKGIKQGNKVVDTENLTDRYALVETAVDFQQIEQCFSYKSINGGKLIEKISYKFQFNNNSINYIFFTRKLF